MGWCQCGFSPCLLPWTGERWKSRRTRKRSSGTILCAGVSMGYLPSPEERGTMEVSENDEVVFRYCGLVSVWVLSLPSPEDRGTLEGSENDEEAFRYCGLVSVWVISLFPWTGARWKAQRTMKGFSGTILWAGVSMGSLPAFFLGQGNGGSLRERGRGLPVLYCGLVSVWVLPRKGAPWKSRRTRKRSSGTILWAGVSVGSLPAFSRGQGHDGSLSER